MILLNKHLNISSEVQSAIKSGLPIVALESTIIAHGMPYPENLAFSRKAETIVRDAGGVPATIAIINGIIKVGLNNDELEHIADNRNIIEKVSLRDIGYVITKKISGATTVSATMKIAHLANIKVFATGGIGGVHRKAEQTLDISQDLLALSQIPIIVISAGVKAILDIPKTLEQLETFAVPAIGYKTNAFPAFYSRVSGCNVGVRFDTPHDIAATFITQQELNIDSALLVANPVPVKNEIPKSELEKFIEVAITECEQKNIGGKKVTPFLLKKIVELSGGKSLETNIALALNNVKLATDIAVALNNF